MKLVILFPPSKKVDDNMSYLIKDENGIYVLSGSLEQSLEAQMESLSLQNNLVPGVIITENTIKEAREESLKYTDSMNEDKLVLQLNSADFVWYQGTKNPLINQKIDSVMVANAQILLYEQENPIAVHPDMNLEEANPDKMIIHLFKVDNEEIPRFENRFGSLKHFIWAANDLETRDSHTFSIYPEPDDLSLSEVVDLVKSNKKTYTTIVMKKIPTLSHASSSSDVICHDSYKMAFYADMVGKVHSDKSRLSAIIRNINQNMNQSNLNSPTVSVVQSSGSGKTKLACSLDDEFPTAYVVFRKANELTYPGRSILGDNFLSCALDSVENSFIRLSETNIGVYAHLIWAIAADYLTRVKELKLELTTSGKTLDSDWSLKIRKTILDEFIEGNFVGTELQIFTNGGTSNVQNLLSATSDSLRLDFKKIVNEIAQQLNLTAKESPLVIILDEVNLLNIFFISGLTKQNSSITRLRLLRRAMHYFGTDANVVFLTLGTKADYLDLNPVISSDSMRDNIRFNIYPPFIVSRNTNLFYNQIAQLSISTEMLKDPRFVLVMFCMGRPLWTSLSISEVVNMALKKLVNSSRETGEAFVACWMIRTGIAASPHMVEMTRHLVKSNMATLLNINPKLNTMNCCYPSEPVLAMAAKKLINDNLVKFYEILRNHLISNGFDRGDLAETLVAEILLEAIQKAPKIGLADLKSCPELDDLKFIDSNTFILESQLNSGAVPESLKKQNISINPCDVKDVAENCNNLTTLRDFLKTIYGDYYGTLNFEEIINKRMLDGIVNFSHFIRLNKGFPLTDFLGSARAKKIQLLPKEKMLFKVKSETLPERDPKGVDLNEIIEEIEKTPRKEPGQTAKKFINRAYNQLGLKRQAAFFAPECHPGIDLVIPICLHDEPESVGEKPTLTVLSIQVKAGHLNYFERIKCANKLFLDDKFGKCTLTSDCQGCDGCETKVNFDFILENQLALVFTLGDSKLEEVKIMKFSGADTKDQNIRDSSNLTVIFNNGLGFLRGLWGTNFDVIRGIINEINQFSWLPHNFIDKSSGTGEYFKNELFTNYLDKPLFPEFSDIFRSELKWPELENPNEDDEKIKQLLTRIKFQR